MILAGMNAVTDLGDDAPRWDPTDRDFDDESNENPGAAAQSDRHWEGGPHEDDADMD